MGARYHDPVVGRFIERDPIGPGYSYAANNPVSFIDPSGLVAQYGGFWNDLRNFFNSPTGKLVTATVAVVGIVTMQPEVTAFAVGVGLIFVAATYVLSGGKATRDDYVAAFSLGFIIGTVIGGGLGFGVEREAGELGAAEPSLSEAASEMRTAANGVRYGSRDLASGLQLASKFTKEFGGLEGAEAVSARWFGGVRQLLKGDWEEGLAAMRGASGEMRVALSYGKDAVESFGTGDILLKDGTLLEIKTGNSLFTHVRDIGQFGKYVGLRESGDISDILYYFGSRPDEQTLKILARNGVDWKLIPEPDEVL